MKQLLNKAWPHAVAIAAMAIITLTYLSPLMKGKTINQSDYAHFQGMSKEIKDFRAETGEEPLWTNSMFGGMPAYQINTLYPANLTIYIHRVMTGWMPRHADLLFGCMLGFYILLCCLKVNPWLGLFGAVAFAFGSYFFIILQVGHLTKLRAIGYMAPVLGAVLLTFRGKYLVGGILMAVFMALEVRSSHIQITYYLFLLLGCVGIAYLLDALLKKTMVNFGKAVGVLAIATVIGIGANITNLWVTYEYGDYTTRGKSELTDDQGNKTGGLDKDYATAWSYGVSESWTLLVANYKGGSSSTRLAEMEGALDGINGQMKSTVGGMGAYFGDQPFTSGPVYAGAIVCLLFVIGLILIQGPLKWGMLAGLILTLMLSWGKNFMPLTDFFLDYVPGYNKFRAVSMTLVVVELVIPIFAVLGLNEIYKRRTELKDKLWVLYVAFGITGGFTLLLWLSPGSVTTFESATDIRLQQSIDQQAAQQQWSTQQAAQISNEIFEGLYQARENVVADGAKNSFLLILVASVLLFGLLHKGHWGFILAIGVLMLGDMWMVNKNYLNPDKCCNPNKGDHFVRKKNMEVPYAASAADLQILKDPDPNYRVYNTTIRFDQDGQTPYFHKSIGGYHGAKFKRYQELIDHHLSQNNMKAMNMLNAKYFIVRGPQGVQAQRNPDALGNAWFVKSARVVANADEEIAAIGDFDPVDEVIIDQRFEEQLAGLDLKPTNGQINLLSYAPNRLVYKSNNSADGFAVFSEIYYDKGWNATIDGEPADHARVNYVLRGMKIPAGEHEIVFEFKPSSYFIGERISLVCSLIIIGLLGYLLYGFFKNHKDAEVGISAPSS